MTTQTGQRSAILTGLMAFLFTAPALPAQEPAAIRFEERFVPGYSYHVTQRVDLSGSLTPPGEKGQPAPKAIAIRGDSTIEYDERVLVAGTGNDLLKTIRQYEKMSFQRMLGDVPQNASLRPGVRRLVMQREGSKKAPFSPDGPLTWDEIDQIRTDVASPLLVGLLPDRPVRPGDTWQASQAMVQELTDLAQVDDGRLICTFDKVTGVEGARLVRVNMSGTIKGRDQDGATEHTLKGFYDFDLRTHCLTFLQLNGTQVMLREGREVGRIEGRFVLNRRPGVENPRLSDEALRGVTLVPDDENSRLLFEDANAGLRVVHPRRWHVAGTRGNNQVGLEAPGGALLLFTVVPAARTPVSAQLVNESREYLEKQKARVLRIDQPQPVPGTSLERFTIETEVEGQKTLMVYYLGKYAEGGLVAVGRIPVGDQTSLLAEVDRIVRGATVTKRPQ